MIAAQAKVYLKAAGRLAVEIGHTQREAVRRLFEAAGFRIVEVRKDLAGRDRVLVFECG
jgi:release factor glutamine methyltransferase